MIERNEPVPEASGLHTMPKVDRINFARKTFAREDWRNAELIDVNAKEAVFEACDFRYAVIDSGYFRNAKFLNCKFEGARFIDCNLKTSHFFQCDFKYTLFERCLLDPKELLASLPTEPNIRRDSLQNLKANAVEVGDYCSLKLIVLEQVKATELHLHQAATGYSGYYKAKYPTLWHRVKAFASLWWLKVMGMIWGHGERPWRLLLSCSMLLLALAFINFWSVMPRLNWNVTGGGLRVGLYVINLFLDMPTDRNFRGFEIVDYVIVVLRYLYVGMFISVLYKAISHR